VIQPDFWCSHDHVESVFGEPKKRIHRVEDFRRVTDDQQYFGHNDSLG